MPCRACAFGYVEPLSPLGNFPCIDCKCPSRSTRLKALQINPNHTPEEAKMRSLPMCAAWLILTGVSVALQSVRTHPLEIIFLLFLTIYGFQAFIAEALGVRVSKKSISFPRRLFPNFPFLVLWRMGIKCADIDQISSRPKARVRVQKTHRRAPAGEFPKSRGAAAIFSICQKRGPFDRHIPLTRAFVRRGFPSPAKARILSRRGLAGARQGMSRLAELAPGISNSRDFLSPGRFHPSGSRARESAMFLVILGLAVACRRVAGVGL